ELRKNSVERAVLGKTVILKLHKKIIFFEAVRQLAERFFSGALSLHQYGLRGIAAHASAESNKSFAMRAKHFEIYARLAVTRKAVDPALAHELYEVAISLLRRREY